MKILSIAFKDLNQQLRSTFAFGMMFLVPLLLVGMIYFAFGGMAQTGEDGSVVYNLPVTRIQIVNLDEGNPTSGLNAGELLVDTLAGESLANLFSVSTVQDEAQAKTAVDNQQAAVAVLIPRHFTQSMMVKGEPVAVTLYQDPTLTFGPGLVKEVVAQFVDGFTASRITAEVITGQFNQAGQSADPAAVAQAQANYVSYLTSLVNKDGLTVLNARSPAAEQRDTSDSASSMASMIGPTMAGMLIFAVFFGAANSTLSILKEQEEGTLARLFTTPTPLSHILGGKFASTFMLLFVQSVVLLVASALLFKINWGGLPQLALVIFAIVIAGAGFGVLLISFAKNARQGGALVGVGLSATSMMGGLFTSAFPNVPAAFDAFSQVMPQGWAMRGLKLVLNGAGFGEILLPVIVLLATGIVFFALGARSFRNRFA